MWPNLKLKLQAETHLHCGAGPLALSATLCVRRAWKNRLLDGRPSIGKSKFNPKAIGEVSTRVCTDVALCFDSTSFIWLFQQIGGRCCKCPHNEALLLFGVYTKRPDFWKLPYTPCASLERVSKNELQEESLNVAQYSFLEGHATQISQASDVQLLRTAAFRDHTMAQSWVVVKTMVPFWALNIVRHLVFEGPKKGPYFDNHPYSNRS